MSSTLEPTATAPSLAAMPRIAIATGIASIVLGVGLVAAATSRGANWVTAGIPAYVGIVFVILGAAATTPALRKHLMHAAAALSLLLVLGGLGMGLPKLIKYYAGTLPADAAVRPLAWWGQVLLAAVMGVFLALAVRSFIAAKRWRQGIAG
jgi:hypothetical protein